MEQKFKISVIIPTYNRALLLKKAIKSVINQTISPFEIIICDDGSTDNTHAVIASFHNPTIKLFTFKHIGLPAILRNKGIQISKGDWIAFLDSDDMWAPKKLEKQIVLINNTVCLAVCSNAYSVNRNRKLKKYLQYSKKLITFSDLIKVNPVILSSVIIHKSLLRKCQGFPEGTKYRNAPDYAVWLKIATQTNFIYSDETLVTYLDDPLTSIRRFTKNPYILKKRILEHFIVWGYKNHICYSYMTEALFYYFQSLKNVVISLSFV